MGKARVPAACLALVAVISALDYATGPELSFSLFYLIPVTLGVWRGGRGLGVSLSVLGALAWLSVEVSTRPYSHVAIAGWNAAIRFGFFLVVTLLLARLREIHQQLALLATTDGLTGVANSRSFVERLAFEVARSGRTGRSLTVAYVDVDDFKFVNDRLGHLGGDQVLRTAARAMREAVRADDFVARLGGDEFALLAAVSKAEDADRVLEKLHRALEVAMGANGWRVTFSIGAVTFLQPRGDPDELIREADAEMYTVKRQGKGRVRHRVAG